MRAFGGKTLEKGRLKDLGVVGRIILKWILTKYGGRRMWVGLIWIRVGM
jgi:hypothetical protein